MQERNRPAGAGRNRRQDIPSGIALHRKQTVSTGRIVPRVGYEIPMTDAVELELDGEWVNGKYGMQLQVEQWREVVPKTKEGVLSYLGSGLTKGIGEKTVAEIVAKFGTNTLDILEKHPEQPLEVRGITENKLEDIRALGSGVWMP